MAAQADKSSRSAEPAGWAGSADDWRRRAGPHNVTLATGQQVTFRLLGVGELMLMGALPDELRELVALEVLNKSKGGIDAVIATEIVQAAESEEAAALLERHLRENFELTKLIIAKGLVEPVLSVEELSELPLPIPFEDFEELARLITGRQPFDSRGVRVGVEAIDVLARFPHHHRCKPGCAACAQALDDLSSVHVGRV